MGSPIVFVTASGGLNQFQARRRDLLRRVIALYPMIDAAIGEASDLRYRSAVLQRGSPASWRRSRRGARLRLRSSSTAVRRPARKANAVHDQLPLARLFARRNGFDGRTGGVARRVLLVRAFADAL